ncbi:MAG: hypothetical protein ACRDJT_04020 [Actinomycetota bacterium]
MLPPPLQRDFFDRARAVAVALMIAAGAAIAIGSFLEWVSLSDVPNRVEDTDFGSEEDFEDEPQRTEPVSGTETPYGINTLVAGAVLIASALALLARRRGKWAWLGFLATVIAGGLAITAYRGIADTSSPLHQELELVGRARPGFGLTLVAGGAIAGLVASVGGVIATPYREPEEEALSPEA